MSISSIDLAVSLNHAVDLDSDIILDNLIKQINIIEQELEDYQEAELTTKVRWIAINKVDLLSKEQLNKLSKKLLNNDRYNKNKIFWISAVSGLGINELCKEIIKYLRV